MRRIEEWVEARLELLGELERRPEGLSWCERHSRLVDETIRSIVPENAPFSVIATGGYGRRELSPYSDIDLTIVPFDEGDPRLDEEVRRYYRELHDAFAKFGLPLGYAFRHLADAPGLDEKSRTGLLDRRLVAGDGRAFRPLIAALNESFAAGDFALAKIRERNLAKASTHDTPLVAEPELKEGAGGLRDFQAANWLRIAIGERPIPPDAAYDTVLQARNLLHLSAGRALDRLTRSRLVEVSRRVGETPVRFADELGYARLSLAHEYARALRRLREARFEISRGVFAARGEIRLSSDVGAGAAAFGISIGIRLGLTVEEFPNEVHSLEAGPEALRAISPGARTIRAVDESGLLEKLLPELTRLRTRLPQDAVHVYTVMEHTLRAVAAIDELTEDSYLGQLLAGLPDRGRLILATLLHDVGKVDGDEGHAEWGAAMAERVGRRWRLGDAVVADVVWLVREHLTMARFIRVRDLERAETIEEFAGIVGTTDRLSLLTLLTYADVKAVAEEVWTPAMDTFLKQLYDRTLARLESARPATGDLAAYRRRLVRRLNEGPIDEEAVERFVRSMPADYLAGTPVELIADHMEYAQRAAAGEPTVEAHPRPDIGATELTVVAQDSSGLLSRLLGVLYASDLGIVSLRARTAESATPVVLDSFVASFGGGPIPTATLRAVSENLRAVARGERDSDDILRARGLDPLRRQELFRWHYVEGTPGILEIRARRGRGMAYRMARRLAALGWNVVSARVGQWAGNAAAAFYIVGADGAAVSLEAVVEAFDVPCGTQT